MAMPIIRKNSVAFAVIGCLAASSLILSRWRGGDPLARIGTSGRTIEARLTAFRYEALRTVRSDHKSAAGEADALADLEARLSTERSADNLHRFALAKLAVNQTRGARELLIEASNARVGDAPILADLAAADLALGDVHDAAEHSARALEIDSQQQTAAFNWALALEKLSNRPAAIEAWDRYLVLDGRSGWADEAREHLSRLRMPRPAWDKDRDLLRIGADRKTIENLITRYPKRSRVRAQEVLLPAWVAGGTDAGLTLLRTMGEIRAAHDDPFLNDVVEHAATHRASITAGMQAFTDARAAEAKIDMETAGTHYKRAAALLQADGSPLAVAASIYAASTDSYGGRTAEALTRLEQVRKQLAEGGNRYPAMAAEAAWVRGMLQMRTGQPNEALESCRAALREAHRGGEIEDEASITAAMATQLESVADPAEAEQFRTDALRRLDEVNAESRSMYSAYLETGTAALRSGRPRLALPFLDSAARIGHAERNAMYVADANLWRALAFGDIGKTDAAMSAIAAARHEAPSIQTPGFRDRTLGNLEFITGRVNAKAQPAVSIAAYSAAIEMWNRNHWRTHIATGYFMRGETFLAMGDRASAEKDFRSSIAEIEDQRRNLAEPAMRISYFERADGVFLRLIEILVDEGRIEEAFSISERKRARALLDQIASENGISAPLDAREVATRIDARTSLLEITLLDRGAELWVMHRGHVFHARGTATGPEIEKRVEEHLAAIASNDLPAVRRHGRWLFDQLIAPVAHEISPDADLVIVPDAGLQSFPFATLVLPDASFLVDRHPLAMAPSASVFLRTSAAAPTGLPILAVAEPTPEGFASLPGSAAEVEALTRQYPRGRNLVGAECSPEQFLKSANTAALVHFAGHAQTDSVQPPKSALIFQSANGAPARLTAEAIGRAHLPTHPLIVLAACSTGSGRVRRNEGVESLASAFLQAGARGVVATLWDVEDAPSVHLFRELHRGFRNGARTIDAVRDAQRACMHSTDPQLRAPSVWASTVVIGTI